MLPLISVAPMLKLTTQHCRHFHRILTKHTLLYTEMVNAEAILHGNRQHLLTYNAVEHPLALQLNGSNPKKLAECAKIGADLGYDEINLNVGCPSKKVQQEKCGAYLMFHPNIVAECINAMRNAVSIPITVKTRLGIVQNGIHASINDFISIVANAGCERFIIHTREANLSCQPKHNRRLSQLNYDAIYQIKHDFPELTLILNGGIKNIAQIKEQLQYVDGIMIGREACRNPYFLATIDQSFYESKVTPVSRVEALQTYIPYIEQQYRQGIKMYCLIRPIIGLFSNTENATKWRIFLNKNINNYASPAALIDAAMIQATSFSG